MSVLFTRMMWLLFSLLTLGLVPARPETVEPGPNSGIVLKEQPGLLITNCRLHTQKVFVRFDPETVCKTNIPTTTKETSWVGQRWNAEAMGHAEADITHMLKQLQKFTITQSELSGASKREKRFIGTLLAAAATVGSLFSLGVSAVNSVQLSTVRRHIGELSVLGFPKSKNR